ncbi:unnamed protein product [Bursaphelenchus okinawaensis]|uniref:Nudix hydrolase domain-containing protein n=1 Tax=Bursaphelenchus okinawaensis TaxID=465554 RepID=A0A811JV73_9BILA|nr:unnamed protein product [Bursaphelenchus okinawaensis]CAG9083938.1 unnamed protein product [Bursaphelenchus okinawaensis]
MKSVEEQVEFLKQRFSRILLGKAEYTAPGPTVKGCNKEASILILLKWKDNDWHVFLTLRSEQMRSHAGEVCFAGGQREDRDKTYVETALREAHEEAGVPSENLQVVGALCHFITRFGIQVHPVVAVLKEEFTPVLNEEVSRCFWMPFSTFLSSEHHTSLHFPEVNLRSHKISYKDEYVFGFTSYVAIVAAVTIYDRYPEFEVFSMDTTKAPADSVADQFVEYNTLPRLMKLSEYNNVTKSKI